MHSIRVLLVGELGRVSVAFRDDDLSAGRTDAVPGHQVYATDAVQVSAHRLVLGRILVVRASLGRRKRGFGAFLLGFSIRANQAIRASESGVTALGLGGVEIEEDRGLREHKEALGAVVALSGALDREGRG